MDTLLTIHKSSREGAEGSGDWHEGGHFSKSQHGVEDDYSDDEVA
jgi:hypothetical protein